MIDRFGIDRLLLRQVQTSLSVSICVLLEFNSLALCS